MGGLPVQALALHPIKHFSSPFEVKSSMWMKMGGGDNYIM